MKSALISLVVTVGIAAPCEAGPIDPQQINTLANTEVLSRAKDTKGNLSHIKTDQAIEAASVLAEKLAKDQQMDSRTALNAAFNAVKENPAIKFLCEFNETWPEYKEYKGEAPSVDPAQTSAPPRDPTACDLGQNIVQSLDTKLAAELKKLEPPSTTGGPVTNAGNQPSAPPPTNGNNPGLSTIGFSGAPIFGKALPENLSSNSPAGNPVHQASDADQTASDDEAASAPSQPIADNSSSLAAFRQVLDIKVREKAIDPALAQALVGRLSANLEQEPDFNLALKKTVTSMKQADAPINPINQIAPVTPPKFQNTQSANIKNVAAEPRLESLREIASGGAVTQATPAPFLAGIAPTNKGATVPNKETPEQIKAEVNKATEAALDKKNAPVPPSLLASTTTSNGSPSAVASAGKLFSLPTKQTAAPTKAPAKSERPTGIGALLDEALYALGLHERTGQRDLSEAFDKSENANRANSMEAAVALMTKPIENALEVTHTVASNYALELFVASFGLSLLLLGLYQQKRQKNRRLP